jgi:hypothetical protein
MDNTIDCEEARFRIDDDKTLSGGDEIENENI